MREHPRSGPSASASVALDLVSVLSLSLDHPSLSFGTFAAGDRPAPLPENVTVSSDNAASSPLVASRTAQLTPSDLPLALSATAAAGGTVGPGLSGGAFVPVPIAPAAAMTLGTKGTSSAAAGDTWPLRIAFASPLPLVPTGHHTATVTFTAIGH